MTAKYTVLGDTTLATSSASVTFSSIPSGYKDLVLVADYAPAGASVGCNFRLNSDLGSNYYTVLMQGNGSTAGSYSSGPDDRTVNWSAGAGLKIFNIMDYTATDKHKTALARENQGGSVVAYAYRWASTSAVSSIEILGTGGSYAIGSTFRLLGVN